MPTSTTPPDTIVTERLHLHRWRPGHAPALKAALDASVHALKPWIPWRIAEPASVPELEQRLARHVDDFDAGREWIYALFAPDDPRVLGAIGLYPRDAVRRVPYAEADRVELGYWLHVDATGRGYATEATQAAIALAESLPRITRLEIRCDPRNTPSAAVPQRLGFAHEFTETRPAATPGEPPSETMIWARPVVR